MLLISRMATNRLYKPIVEFTRTQSRFILFLYSLIFLEMAYLIITYFSLAYKCITYPYQVDYEEGFLLFFTQTFSEGKSIYQDVSQFPFIPTLYPPVYTLICAALSKIFGLKFMIGRSLSFISALLICLFIYLIVARSARRYIAIISSVLFLASPYVIAWSLLYRIDTTALLFSLIGMYIVLKYENSRFIFFSIPFFLLSVFTKQTFIAAPVAAFIYLFTKDTRIALKLSVLFGLSGLLIFGLIDFLTDGQFYIHLFVDNAIVDFSLKRTFTMYKEFFLNHMFLFSFAFSYALYALSTNKSSLFVFYFVIASITPVTVGKLGSGVNYFMELIATSCILFGFIVEELSSKLSRENVFQILLATILAIQFIPNLRYFGRYSHIQNIKYGERISNYVRQSNGKGILTEDAGFAVLNGKIPVTEPFANKQLSKHGLWDQSVLLKYLRDKSISLAILKTNLNNIGNDNIRDTRRFTKEVIRELKNNYKLVDKFGYFYIYKPSTKMSNKKKHHVMKELK